MKHLFIYLLLFGLSLTTNAQSNYKKGYVITNKNDTIRGFIDFRTDKMNSSLCKFKRSENDYEQKFHPGEINVY